jgi:hypothetical protein
MQQPDWKVKYKSFSHHPKQDAEIVRIDAGMQID